MRVVRLDESKWRGFQADPPFVHENKRAVLLVFATDCVRLAGALEQHVRHLDAKASFSGEPATPREEALAIISGKFLECTCLWGYYSHLRIDHLTVLNGDCLTKKSTQVSRLYLARHTKVVRVVVAADRGYASSVTRKIRSYRWQ